MNIRATITVAIQYLTAKEHLTIKAHQKIVETSCSIVYKTETSESVVYLKQVPEATKDLPNTVQQEPLGQLQGV